jgi:membrane protease YdiL (CAAX protease family)
MEPVSETNDQPLPPEPHLGESEAGAAAPPPVPFAKYPEDLRAPWTWLDVLIFVVLSLGIQIVLDAVLLNAAVNLGYVKPDRAAMEQFARTSAAYVTLRQVILSAMLMAYLFFALRLRSTHSFWRLLGWRPVSVEGYTNKKVYWACALAGVPLAMMISMLSKFAVPKQKLPIEVFFQDARSVLLLSAMGILIAPLVEETLFRGFLYPVAARTFGIPGGVVVTGVLFGALHAPQLEGGWAQIGLLVLVGILFTTVRARLKSVTACYFLHLGYNSFLFLAFIAATDFLRNIPAR